MAPAPDEVAFYHNVYYFDDVIVIYCMTLNNLALLQRWGVFTNAVAYADYIVLTAASWKSMLDLLMYFTFTSINIDNEMNVKQCALFSNPNDDYRLYLLFPTA